MLNRIVIVVLLVSFAASANGYVSLKTPLERKEYQDLSGYEEIAAYLDTLLMVSTSIEIDTIGQSVEGRAILALYFTQDEVFGANREKKPVVLIYCQQHGNEPAGKEGALLLARHMATDGTTILKHVDLILVPQVNPDGGEARERNNANDMDLNRNHVVLSEPEAQAIHDLFLKWMPEVTLDVHEYGAISALWIEHGMVKDAEIMVGGVTNPNIDDDIAEMARELFIPEIGRRVRAAGYSFHRYVVGSPFEDSRMRYSTTDLNDGRQSMGIYNTLSFIQEGKRYADQVTQLERRGESQMTGMLAMLEVVAKNAHDVIETVERCRERITAGNAYEWAHVQMDYFPDPAEPTVRFPVFDLEEWRHVERDLEQFEPLVMPKKSVRRPEGYVFSGSEERLIELLTRHGIKMELLNEAKELEVETYTLHHITVMEEEELEVPNVDVITETAIRRFPKGSAIVPLNQPAGILIPLLLEPQSTRGILAEGSAHQYHFGEYLVAGEEYSIHRIVAAPGKNDERTMSEDRGEEE